MISEELTQGLNTSFATWPHPDPAGLKAARMGEQVGDGDWLVVGVRDGEVEIRIDVLVEVHAPLFHELHDCGGGKRLADRPDPKHCGLRVNGPQRCDISVPVSSLKEHRPVLHNHNHPACEVICIHFLRNGIIEERGEHIWVIGGWRFLRPHRAPAKYDQKHKDRDYAC